MSLVVVYILYFVVFFLLFSFNRNLHPDSQHVWVFDTFGTASNLIGSTMLTRLA